MEEQYTVYLMTPVHSSQLERVAQSISERVKADPDKIRARIGKGIGSITSPSTLERAQHMADVFRESGLDVEVRLYRAEPPPPASYPSPDSGSARSYPAPSGSSARPYSAPSGGGAAIYPVPGGNVRLYSSSGSSSGTFNPWLGIMMQPRRTMRYVYDNNLCYDEAIIVVPAFITSIFGGSILSALFLLVLALIGIYSFTFPYTRLGHALFVPIFALVGIYISAFIYTYLGRALGGKGSFSEVKSAAAWSTLPGYYLAAAMTVFGLVALLIGNVSPGFGGLLAFRGGIGYYLIVTIWFYIVQIKTLAEAHRVSSWHAFGITIIPVSGLLFLMLLLFDRLISGLQG